MWCGCYTQVTVRRWNRTAAECYLRDCICEGCPIYERYFRPVNGKCCMKWAVMEMVRKFGIPEALKKIKGRLKKLIIEETQNER